MPATFSLDQRIEQLRQFKDHHGHLFIPTSLAKNGLGKWAANMRYRYKTGKMKADDIAKLNAIEFQWENLEGPAKAEQIAWGKQFKLLEDYYNARGHCNVPSTIGGQENPTFAWCEEQRRDNINGKISQSNKSKLSKLGFDFFGSSGDAPPSKRQRTGDEKEMKALLEKMQAIKDENVSLKDENASLKKKILKLEMAVEQVGAV